MIYPGPAAGGIVTLDQMTSALTVSAKTPGLEMQVAALLEMRPRPCAKSRVN
jgi:hypothetical protein